MPARAHRRIAASVVVGALLWVAATIARAEPQRTVLVVGGGYGGLEAAQQLAKEGSTRVVLVDREANNARITHLPGYIAYGEDIETPFADLAKQGGFSFVKGEVTRWDAAKKQIQLASGDALGYDAIIVAVGGKMAQPASVSGVEEHAYGFRTLREARALKQALAAKLKALPKGQKLDVAVVGAGPSGIELAGAIARAHPEQAQVHLVQRGDHVKPFGDSTTPGEGHETAAWLRDLGITVSTGTTPSHIDAKGLEVVSAGQQKRIQADLVVATMGDVGAGGELGHGGDKQSRMEVDAFLQRVGAHDAFVIGDAAAITDGATGQAVAQAAKKAKAQGEHAAQNLLRRLRGQSLVAYVDLLKSAPAGGTGPGSRVQKFLDKHVGKGPAPSFHPTVHK